MRLRVRRRPAVAYHGQVLRLPGPVEASRIANVAGDPNRRGLERPGELRRLLGRGPGMEVAPGRGECAVPGRGLDRQKINARDRQERATRMAEVVEAEGAIRRSPYARCSRRFSFRHCGNSVPKSPGIDAYRPLSGDPSDGPGSVYLRRFLASCRASANVLCKQEVTGSIPVGSIT
jgi:hypothetical protein